MTAEAFADVLSGDCQRIEAALVATHFSDFMDRPDALAKMLAPAIGHEDFPGKHRASQAKFLADVVLATDGGTSVRYLRRVFRREGRRT